MIQQFKSFIQDQKLFSKDNRILLAVSGGIDSVVMSELFDKCGFSYGIAHCNFGLRGTESDEDAKFVQNLAEGKRVEFHSEMFNTKAFAREQKISIQVAARQLRMNWMSNLLDQFGYDYYATAHHQDDQIESFFINLFRGTGISGLHGILPKQGKLIHPMLFTNRENIGNFAKKNKLAYREDSSNLKNDYTRNKIRHQLIPVIKKLNPEYTEIFTENVERLQQTELIYLQQINAVASRVIMKEDGLIKISLRLLSALEPVESYLFEFLSPYDFNISDVKNILAALNGKSGKMFLSKSHRIFKDRDYLILEKLSDKEPKREKFQIHKGTLNIFEPLNLEINLFEKSPDFKYNSDKNQAYLDADKVIYPLMIRKWEKGDYFYPIGMNHKKLLSDFFIDHKFPIPEKEKTWLLTSGEQVVWVIGHRIDNRYKITPGTQHILSIFKRS
jgi:tRNA(Ile)-lysidine synthase